MPNHNTTKRACDYYSGYRHPKVLIGYVVWQYHRFMLSLRDVSELLIMLGISVSHETIAKKELLPSVEHRQHKGLNNCAENSHQPTRQQER